MKRLIFLVLTVFGIGFAQQAAYPTFTLDSIRFVRPADTIVYASGDIVADSGAHHKYFTFSNIGGGTTDARGRLTNVTVLMDTAHVSDDTVKVGLFSSSDTTGLWGALPADNAAFQSKFQYGGGKYIWLGNVTVILKSIGTTAGGATTSEGTATCDIRYKLPNGYLYAVVIAAGTFEPKSNGIWKVLVWAEKQK